MTDDPLTLNFTLAEFLVSETASRRGIDNTPPPSVEATIRNVLMPGMQSIRDLLAAPVVIHSGYRSPTLNRAVGGSPMSQHTSGHAADFTAPGYGSPLQICKVLVRRMEAINWDQLIMEGGWVHVSFAPRPRRQVLTAHFSSSGVTYTPGLPA